jgi:hypothetical protein
VKVSIRRASVDVLDGIVRGLTGRSSTPAKPSSWLFTVPGE